MNIPFVERLRQNPVDLSFLAILAICFLLAVGAVHSALEKKEALQQTGGARKVDLQSVRKQISDGTLSPRKALFYKHVPR